MELGQYQKQGDQWENKTKQNKTKNLLFPGCLHLVNDGLE